MKKFKRVLIVIAACLLTMSGCGKKEVATGIGKENYKKEYGEQKGRRDLYFL